LDGRKHAVQPELGRQRIGSAVFRAQGDLAAADLRRHLEACGDPLLCGIDMGDDSHGAGIADQVTQSVQGAVQALIVQIPKASVDDDRIQLHSPGFGLHVIGEAEC
jgi:hypothetical protein